MNKRTIKQLMMLILVLFIISIFFGIPSNIRYEYEKRFGNPTTFFYETTLAIMLGETNNYEKEFNLDNEKNISIDVSKYRSTNDVTFFLHGRFVNSADPLVVMLNDKIVYNGNAERDSANFYSRHYILKHFVVKLGDFVKTGTNKVTISTGNANEVFYITSK